jgi:protein-S-isoprenylcysteine O-methyltransferase Ste14
MSDLPLLVVAVTVSLYWTGVGAMVVRVRRHLRKDAGLVPEQARERMMWLVWVPLVASWIALPWLATTHAEAWLAVPSWAREGPMLAVRVVAAVVAVGCLLATARCWKRMGDDWRMDVSSRSTALITDGPFRRIRHPIYAFSILLMICTAVVLPTAPMIAIAIVHVTLMHVKARNEEAHLASVHGAAYAQYAARTGRFVPRLTTREP